jgi:hypothetical protein
MRWRFPVESGYVDVRNGAIVDDGERYRAYHYAPDGSEIRTIERVFYWGTEESCDDFAARLACDAAKSP